MTHVPVVTYLLTTSKEQDKLTISVSDRIRSSSSSLLDNDPAPDAMHARLCEPTNPVAKQTAENDLRQTANK